MKESKNTLFLLENFNALIKYHIKAYKEDLFCERKIDVNFEDIPDIESFCSEVQQILEQGEYTHDFVHLISRIYLISESNSDLLIDGNRLIKEFPKELKKIYPFFNFLDTFSLDVFRFIYYDVWNAKDEYGRVLRFKSFDYESLSKMIESSLKDDVVILWQTYYLLQDVTNAYLTQEKQDIEHQLLFKLEPDKEKFIQRQKEKRVEEIINLSNDFCDKNLPFMYIKDNPIFSQDNLFYFLLSEVMDRLSLEEYENYIKFDYLKYQLKKYQWNFASISLNNYVELQQLSGFNKLVRILANALLIKDYTEIEENKVSEPVEVIENKEELEDCLEKKEKELDEKEKRKSEVKSEHILPVPILDLIYQEFNDEQWNSITLIEFLNMFTTDINKQDNFKLKQKQTTRFYYLLKKIWINSSNKLLFATEKEWIIPFLQNYGLSYSAYTNQFIKNEGGLKHRNFIKSVDKILPKDEIE